MPHVITHETDITIDAPPSEVWRHLVDFDRHPEWTSQFQLRGRPVAGEPGHVRFRLFGRKAGSPVTIERVEDARELRWRGGPKGLVTGSHYFILEGRDGGRRTHFRHGETFSGVFAPLVWALLEAQLGPAYPRFNEDLKRRAEGG